MNSYGKQRHLAARTSHLRLALEESLRDYFCTPVNIIKFKRHLSDYSSSFAIEELEVVLDSERELNLVFKDLSKSAFQPDACWPKPDFLFNPRREIYVYQSILPFCTVDTATCIGSVIDEQSERFWLFLEKVQGTELSQVGDFEVWLEVARGLARMHEFFSASVNELAPGAPLLNYGRDFYRAWPERAKVFLDSDRVSDHAELDRIHRSYPQVIEQILGLPLTLLHGDFNASNIMVQIDQETVSICPIDWEMAGVGPGLIDLASLVSGSWNGDQREALIDAYFETVSKDQNSLKDRQVMGKDVKYCQLHLAMQWLGWSPRWTPPPEHEQDWLKQAFVLADQLEL